MTQSALQILASTGVGTIAARAMGFSPYAGALVGLASSITRTALNKIEESIAKWQESSSLSSVERRRKDNEDTDWSTSILHSNYPYQALKRPDPALGASIYVFALTLAATKLSQYATAYFGRVVALSDSSFAHTWTIATISSAISNKNFALMPSIATLAAYATGLKPQTGVLIGVVTAATLFLYDYANDTLNPEWSVQSLKPSLINVGKSLLTTQVAQWAVSYFRHSLAFPETFALANISTRLGVPIGNKIHELINSRSSTRSSDGYASDDDF